MGDGLPIVYIERATRILWCCDIPGRNYCYSTVEIMISVLRDQGYSTIRLSKGACRVLGYEHPYFHLITNSA